MSKRIVVQVQISSEKCRTTILTTAAKLKGVNSIDLDDNKGVLTIIGTADAVKLMQKLRKAKILAEIISIGPEKKEEKKEKEKKEKKDENKIECTPYQYGFPHIMSNKKIELQVQICCEKCRTIILTAAAKLKGVNSINLDDNKGVLIIKGMADAVKLVHKLRKAKIPAEIISIGPEKKDEKKEKEKKEEKKEEKKKEKKDEKKIECMPYQYGFPQIVYYEQYPESKQPPYQYGFPQIVYYEQYPESKQPPYQYGFS